MNINPNMQKVAFEHPEWFADFLRIIEEFYRLQGEVPAPVRQEDGPHQWVAGETPVLTTVGISHEDIDAIEKGYAEATVKERAWQRFVGFVSGVLLLA